MTLQKTMNLNSFLVASSGLLKRTEELFTEIVPEYLEMFTAPAGRMDYLETLDRLPAAQRIKIKSDLERVSLFL